MAEEGSSLITIPWDILREVASYIIDDKFMRLTFMKVDKLWRSVIIDTPSFWTTIAVCSPFSFTLLLSQAMDRITWLAERSKSLPVRVTWNLTLLGDVPNEAVALFFVQKVPPERWQFLLIANTERFLNPGALSMIFARHKFTSLQHLSFTYTWSSPANIVKFIEMIEASAPTLSSITVSNVLSSPPPPRGLLPLSLIGPQTEVIFPDRGHALDEAIAIALLPNIQNINIVWEPNVAYTGVPLNSFSSLVKLTILYFHCYGLKSLHLPRLEELYIKSSQNRQTDITLPKLRLLSLQNTAMRLLPCFDASLLEELHLEGEPLGLDAALDDPSYQISPDRLIIDTKISSTTFFLLISLSPRLKHLQILRHSRTQTVGSFFDLLLSENKAVDGNSKSWRLCRDLRRLDVLVQSVRLINDATWLDEPAKKLFHERSKSGLESISIDWRDGSLLRFHQP
jgi:hypothetical protein